MRTYGALSPTDSIEAPSRDIQTLLIANSSGQAMNWAGSTVGSSGARAQLARFTGWSTAGAAINFLVNLHSTACAAPSSGYADDSTEAHAPVNGTRTFQIPGGSTGFSVASLSSGYIIVEIWSK